MAIANRAPLRPAPLLLLPKRWIVEPTLAWINRRDLAPFEWLARILCRTLAGGQGDGHGEASGLRDPRSRRAAARASMSTYVKAQKNDEDQPVAHGVQDLNLEPRFGRLEGHKTPHPPGCCPAIASASSASARRTSRMRTILLERGLSWPKGRRKLLGALKTLASIRTPPVWARGCDCARGHAESACDAITRCREPRRVCGGRSEVAADARIFILAWFRLRPDTLMQTDQP